MTAAGSPTVLIVAPDTLVREALMASLAEAPRLEVVAGAADREAAESAVREHEPAVTIVDVALAGALELCGSLKSAGGRTRVVLYNEAAGDEETLVAAVEAATDGYVEGDVGLDGLVTAIEQVAAGQSVVPPSMLGTLLRQLIHRGREEARVIERFMTLTPREKEILAFLIEGYDQHGIAERLVISPETARTHIQNLLNKLDVRSRLEAARLAMRHGLVDRLPTPTGAGDRR